MWKDLLQGFAEYYLLDLWFLVTIDCPLLSNECFFWFALVSFLRGEYFDYEEI